MKQACAPGGRPAFFSAPILQSERLWALVFLALGYAFWECFWAGGAAVGPALAAFGAGYAAAVLAFARAHGLRPPRESWVWLAVWQGILWAVAWPLGGGPGLGMGLAAVASAVLSAGYWAYAVCGGLTQAHTGVWLPVDLACCFFAGSPPTKQRTMPSASPP